MNIDTNNPGSSGSHAPTPSSASTSAATKKVLPPLPQKQSPTTEEHLYQNISPSTSSSALAAAAKDVLAEQPHPSNNHPSVSPRPSGVQRNVSSSTPFSSGNSSTSNHSSALTVDRAKEEDKPAQSHPMPKPRSRSKKVTNSSSSSSSTSTSAIPPASPAVQPPSTLAKPLPVLPPTNRQPPTATKLAPPGVTPRVKGPSGSDALPPLNEKPPKLPNRLDVSPPVSPSHLVVSGKDQATVQHLKDEDEFGYGLINVADSKPPVPKSPRPPRTEPAKTSLMDTVSATHFLMHLI